MATTKTETKVEYLYSISRQAWTPNGWYPPGHEVVGFSYYSYSAFQTVPRWVTEAAEYAGADVRQAVLDWADKYYGPESGEAVGSYKLLQVTKTKIVTEDGDPDYPENGSLLETVERVVNKVFFTFYRTEEQHEAFLKEEQESKAKLALWEKKYEEEQAAKTAELEIEEAKKTAELEMEEELYHFKAEHGRIHNLVTRTICPWFASNRTKN